MKQTQTTQIFYFKFMNSDTYILLYVVWKSAKYPIYLQVKQPKTKHILNIKKTPKTTTTEQWEK